MSNLRKSQAAGASEVTWEHRVVRVIPQYDETGRRTKDCWEVAEEAMVAAGLRGWAVVGLAASPRATPTSGKPWVRFVLRRRLQSTKPAESALPDE